ncbi:MAG: hypothetical protein GX868_15865 [Actinobacteria bacterium]|nr:hypothetical protein [Actinomycetota bacterium]
MNYSTDPFPALDELERPGELGRSQGLAPVSAAEREAVFAAARREGFDLGASEGRLAGRDEAIQAARPDVAFALTALAEAIEDLHRRDGITAAALAERTVDLALAVAESVIGRELQVATATGRDALVRAMTVAPDRGPAVARLHPIDVATLREADHVIGGRSIDIVADDSVERGGSIVTVGSTSIDAQLGTALERVRLELQNIDVVTAIDEAPRAELTVFEGGRS